MRKLTTITATLAASIILVACQPAAKEEVAAPEATDAAAVTTEAAPTADAPAATATADAAKADVPAATADEAAAPEGTEHTGGIKVGQ